MRMKSNSLWQNEANKMKIGVLALQGAFIEHRHKLSSLGIDSIELRQKEDLKKPLFYLAVKAPYKVSS